MIDSSRLQRFLNAAPERAVNDMIEMYKSGDHTQAGIARIIAKKYGLRVISENVHDIVLHFNLPQRCRREWNEIAVKERMRKKLTADPWLRATK